MKKRLAAITLVFSLFVVVALPFVASAQTLSITKVVSVVFDDSGSMSSNGSKNWAYANYAMQAFCGLLNKEDKLYITYMSDYSVAKEFDLTGDIQKQVDSIHDHYESSGTPIESVDTAIDKLKSVQSSNKNTQYWLVVITDGGLARIAGDNSQVYVTQGELEKKISDVVSESMPNGSKPRVTYLAIGDQAPRPKADEKNGIFVYPKSNDIVDGNEIIKVMSEMADMVSGRIRVPENKMRFMDDTTVEITSDLPMFNIAVLSQKTSAEVIDVTSADASLKLVQSAKLIYPEVQGQDTDKSLKGTTALFNNGSLNIPMGIYTFKFSEPVSRDSVVIMYEPAIEMRMKVYLSNQQEVTDMKSLYSGDKIDVVCKIYERGTDKEIDPSLLNSDVAYNVSYSEGNSVITKNDNSDLTLRGITLKAIDSELKATIEIPGFLPMTNTIAFHPASPVTYTMSVTAPKGDTIKRNSLYDNDKGLLFTVFMDGNQMAKADLEGLDVHFTMKDPFRGKLELDSTLNDDGTYTCIPRYDCLSFPAKWCWNWMSAWMIPTGKLSVTGGISDGSFKELSQGALQIERENILLTIFFYLLPFIILFFLLGFIFKRRFKRGTRAKYINAQNRGTMFVSVGAIWTIRKLRAFTLFSLVPWLSQRRRVAGIVFYARPRGAIGVKINKIGVESRHLSPNSVRDDQMVKLSTVGLKRSFVPSKKEERTGFEEFDIEDVLMLASNLNSCTFIKFIGDRR